MAITKEVLDELLKDYRGPDDLTGDEGLLKQLTKALVERAMGAELTEHLGYEKHEAGEKPSGNRRNGRSPKTVRSDQGPITLEVPRDREGTFEPKIVGKHQRELPGFSDKILSMYARGMTTREIGEHLKEIYGTEVSPQFITSVTDAVVESLEGWRNRELEAVYPIVFFDAIVVKVRDNGHVVKKAIYLALAITLEGKKELLGLWIDQSEGAKFWLGIISELKNRGVQDILIAAVDGLSGFPDAIRAVYPATEVQLCLVHVVRSSLRFVPYKDRRIVAAGLKTIYSAPTEEAALAALEEFRGTWDGKYPMIGRSWHERWTEIVPFLAYAPEIRKVIYTTNAIESLNYTLRKVTRNRQAFPTSESAMKLVYMALQNISRRWTMPVQDWSQALNQLAIKFTGRVPV
jgi:transposase-like protein